MKEEKSYFGLVVWLAGFLAATALCIALPEEWMLRGVMQVCSLGISALILMIYRNEKVYWINGVTFEAALSATSVQRKAFAFAHLKRFLYFSVPYFLFSCLSWALGWNEWWDFGVGTIGLIICAISTINIRLETKKTVG